MKLKPAAEWAADNRALSVELVQEIQADGIWRTDNGEFRRTDPPLKP